METLKIQWNEEKLQNYLIKNIKKHYPNFKIIKSEYEIPNGRIDLLCKDTEYKDVYWVIELKSNIINCDSAIQVLRYTQYMNSEKSKDGKRKFYPLIIGRDICKNQNHLDKFLFFYDGCPENFCYCFYNLYDFNVENMDFNFTWFNKLNKEYFENNFNERNCLDDKINDLEFKLNLAKLDIKELKEENKQLKSKKGAKNGTKKPNKAI